MESWLVFSLVQLGGLHLLGRCVLQLHVPRTAGNGMYTVQQKGVSLTNGARTQEAGRAQPTAERGHGRGRRGASSSLHAGRRAGGKGLAPVMGARDARVENKLSQQRSVTVVLYWGF